MLIGKWLLVASPLPASMSRLTATMAASALPVCGSSRALALGYLVLGQALEFWQLATWFRIGCVGNRYVEKVFLDSLRA